MAAKKRLPTRLPKNTVVMMRAGQNAAITNHKSDNNNNEKYGYMIEMKIARRTLISSGFRLLDLRRSISDRLRPVLGRSISDHLRSTYTPISMTSDLDDLS